MVQLWVMCRKEAGVQAFPAVMSVSVTLFGISQPIRAYPFLEFIFGTLPVHVDSSASVSVKTGVLLLVALVV